ncbi:MAG: hypothetical protein IPG84_09250 [Betaproteobacteria bacterium]|nr:hypothetical protein [Betaproteobacteria bacterium]
MNIMRKAMSFVMAMAVAAFALPGMAAGPAKQFSINVTKGAVVAPGISEFWLEIRNETPNGNSTINSMKVTLPGSLTIKNSPPTYLAASTSPASGQVAAPEGAAEIAISNMYPLKPQQTLTLKFWANTNTAATCTGLHWSAQAWTGSSFNGDTFTQLTPAQVLAATNPPRTIVSSTAIATDAALKFGSITSVVVGEAFSVTVNQTSACASITLPPVSVTAAATGYASAVMELTVFDGTLGCVSTPFNAIKLLNPTDPTFNSGNSFDQFAAAAEGLSGYLFGARGPTDSKSDSGCTLINYSVTNRINTTSSQDPVGNTVPAGYYSFTFDSGDPDDPKSPVVGIVATFRRMGDPATGLPAHKTLICNVELPTLCTTDPYDEDGEVQSPWKPAVACLSTSVQRSSIPPGEIGCVAFEQWEVVAPSGNCPGTPPGVPVCLKPTAIMIMGKDPVFGRGN